MTDSDACRESTIEQPPDQKTKGSTVARVGVVLMVLACLFWLGLLAIPFLPLTVGQKASLAVAGIIVVQIKWWTGTALAGPQMVAGIKAWLKRRKQANDESLEE